MEISIRRINNFLNAFICPYDEIRPIKQLMLPTCDIITDDDAQTCRIIDIKINKIIELTERNFYDNEIHRINYKDKEQFYIMSNLILDKRGNPLLCAKRTKEIVKVNGRDTTQIYDDFYISNEVMLDTKSWICFVIRKYIIYYVLDSFQRKRVHVISKREISARVKCNVNTFTSKNIAKIKIINGDND